MSTLRIITDLPDVGADDGTWGAILNACLTELDTAAALAADVYTKTEADAKYVQTINGTGPDEDGNVVVEGGSGGTFSGVPLDGSVTDAKIASGGLSPSKITGTAVINSDSRLADSRTPKAHKSTHATGGTDALAASDIGAIPSSTKGAPSGVAPLGLDAKVSSTYLPAFIRPGSGTSFRLWVQSTAPTVEAGATDGDLWAEIPAT